MKCPGCGEAMQDGRAEVHNSPGTIFFRNLSLQDLYWYDESRRRKSLRRLIEAGQARPAFGCRRCGLITIDTTAELDAPDRWYRRKRRGDAEVDGQR